MKLVQLDALRAEEGSGKGAAWVHGVAARVHI